MRGVGGPLGPRTGRSCRAGRSCRRWGLAAPGALEVDQHEDLLGDAQGVEGCDVDPERPHALFGPGRVGGCEPVRRTGCDVGRRVVRRQDGRLGRRRRRRPRAGRSPARATSTRPAEGALTERLDARRGGAPEGSQSHSEFPLLSPSSWGTPVASTPRADDRFGGPADSESPVTLRPHLTMGLPFRRCRLLGAPNWRSRYQGGKRECKGFLAGRATFPHPMMRCARACRRVGVRRAQ